MTETDHYHWSVAKFLKLNIKMYKFYCQLYLLPKPEVMGAMAKFFKTRKSVCCQKRQIGREQLFYGRTKVTKNVHSLTTFGGKNLFHYLCFYIYINHDITEAEN